MLLLFPSSFRTYSELTATSSSSSSIAVEHTNTRPFAHLRHAKREAKRMCPVGSLLDPRVDGWFSYPVNIYAPERLSRLHQSEILNCTSIEINEQVKMAGFARSYVHTYHVIHGLFIDHLTTHTYVHAHFNISRFIRIVFIHVPLPPTCVLYIDRWVTSQGTHK